MHSPVHDLFVFLAINLVVASPFLAFLLERRGFFGDRVRLVPVAQALAIQLAIVSIGAGAIHLSALPFYVTGGPQVLVLLGGGGLAQIAWGVVWLRRPTLTKARMGIVLNVVLFAAWLVSRSVGLPFGSHEGVPELVGIGDSFTTMFAGTVAIGLLVSIWPASRKALESRLMPPESASLGVLMAMVVVAMLTVFAIVAGMAEAVPHTH